MELHAVHARQLGEGSAPDKLFDQFAAFLGGEFPWSLPDRLAWNGAWGDRLNSSQLIAGYLPSGMMKLQKDLGVILVDRIGQPFQPADIFGRGDGELVYHTRSRALVYPGDLGYYQAAASLGAGLIKLDDLIGSLAVKRRHVGSHRRHNYSIAQL